MVMIRQKISMDLNRIIGLRTIERWCQSIRDTGAINLSRPPGCPSTIRTKGNIQKIKYRLERRKRVFSRKLSRELGISRTSVQRILKNDQVRQAYQLQKEPLLTDEHKEKRIQFANWIRTNFRKGDTMKILFYDEKMFDIDGVYKSQNDRIWPVDRSETDASEQNSSSHQVSISLNYAFSKAKHVKNPKTPEASRSLCELEKTQKRDSRRHE